MRYQQGYLLMVGAIMLVVLAGVLTVYATIINTAGRSVTQSLQSTQAEYIAEGGLEKARYDIRQGNLICNNNNTVSGSVGDGEFVATVKDFSPSPNFHLASNITSSSTTVPVSPQGAGQTIDNMAPSGRVTIDNEIIEYAQTSSDSSSCNGNPPCLTQAKRGINNTNAVSHSSNTDVIQDQIFIWSKGYVPTQSSPKTVRAVGGAVYTSADAVGVGDLFNKVLKHDLCNSWAEKTHSANNNAALNDIVCLQGSVKRCFAAGNDTGQVLYYNGDTWQDINTPDIGAINGIDCGSSTRCWAVSDSDDYVLLFNGSDWSNSGNWSLQSLPSDYKGNLRGISCNNSAHCMAVGINQSTTGQGSSLKYVVLQNQGSGWQQMGSLPSSYNKPLNTVSCTSNSNCWAAGESNNKILYYDGNSWQKQMLIVYNDVVNDLTCTSASNCRAVGNKTDRIAYYNGSNWSTHSIPGSYSQILRGVSCRDSSECYAVGDQANAILKWNGSQWKQINTNYTAGLNAIDVVGNNNKRFETGGWQEQVK